MITKDEWDKAKHDEHYGMYVDLNKKFEANTEAVDNLVQENRELNARLERIEARLLSSQEIVNLSTQSLHHEAAIKVLNDAVFGGKEANKTLILKLSDGVLKAFIDHDKYGDFCPHTGK